MRSTLICILWCGFNAPAAEPSELEKKASDLQQVVFGILRDVQPAVVHLTREETPGASGTIISADGLILTCAHINAEVGDEILVRTADGEQHRGKVLAKSSPNGEFGDDLALVQLTDKGPWPFAPVGTVGTITPETPMLAFGHPATGLLTRPGEPPPRQVRIGYRIRSEYTDKAGLIRTTIRGFAGDSGGPVFDLQGRLIGVTTNFESGGTCLTFNTVDLLRERWKVLAGNRPVPPVPEGARPEFPTLHAVFGSTIAGIQRLVVEVHSNFRPIASGLVVARGRVLTKASALGPNLTVAFEDEAVAHARVAAVDHSRDLALLAIGTSDFDDSPPPVPWAKSAEPGRGQFVAVASPSVFRPPVGMVAVGAVRVPPMEGSIPVLVKDDEGGVAVTQIIKEVFLPGQESGFPLRVGDIITHIHGSPTPDMQGWLRRFEEWPPTGDRPRIAGEPVTVRYLRKGAAEEATFPLALSRNPTHSVRASSCRATGFSKAVVAQFHQSRPEHCGSPVVDASGQVVGILIAKSESVEDLVLPVDEVMQALRHLEPAGGKK